MQLQFNRLLVTLLLLYCKDGFSQSAFDPPVASQSPNILPPSPEAYSFTKYGTLPIGLNTGTAEYSFPVYTIRSGKLSHSITLGYSSNGVKVDEMATRTGINWRLAAGGAVTRAVMDKPDGEAGISPTFYHGLTGVDSTNHELFTYIRQASQSGAPDFQPDEYSFSMDGYSGKFLKRENGDWGQLGSSAIKIEKNSSGFILTAPNGVKYFFYAVETARNYSYPESYETLVHVQEAVPTSWFLTKILTPYKDSIVFNYSSLLSSGYQTYKNGIVQDYSCKDFFGGATIIDYTGGGIGDYPQLFTSPVPPGLVTEMNYSDNEVKYLSSINFNNGRVDFIYAAREDVPGEKRLDTIKVTSTADSSVVRCVKLNYSYSQTAHNFYDTYIAGTNYTNLDTSLRKRLFLTGIDELTNNLQPLLHTGFEYNSINNLPPRLSFSQDRFGSFNGKVNAVYFIPNDTWFDKFIGNNRFGGDRSYDFNSAKMGMLTKITYSTGGYTSFEYEPNKTTNDYAYILRHDSIYAIADTSSYSGQEFLSDTIHFTAGGELHLHGYCEWASNPVYTIVNGQATDLDDAYHVNVDLIDISTNACVSLCGGTINPGESFMDGNFGFPLPSGTYRLKLTANRARLRAMIVADKQWKENDRSPLSGIAGVRVKSLTDYSADSVFAGKREYLYGDWDDSTSSSGYGLNINANNGNEATFVRVIGLGPDGITPVRCGYNTIHSNSTLATYLTDNSTVLYSKVIELTTTPGGKNNGGTEYEYYYAEKLIAVPLSYIVPSDVFHAYPIVPVGVPWSNRDFLSGRQKSARQFTYSTKYGTRNLLRESVNYYSVDTAHLAIDTFLVARKVRTDNITQNSEFQNFPMFADYDMGRYWRYFGFVKLDSSIETSYADARQLTHKTTYSAYSGITYQPTEIKTVSSKNEVQKITKKYAGDVVYGEPGYDIYSAMAAKNMLDGQIEEKRFTGTVENSSRQTPFTQFTIGSDNYYLPALISTSKSGRAPATDITFQQYDAKGNTVQYTAKDGIPNSFIWDYNKQYPIAKAINADSTAIAYTSFEADGTGNFTIGSSSRDSSVPAITGRKYYNLANGNISKGGLTSGKSYIVSYWSTNGAKTISGGSGSSRTGRTVNGWTYYEHVITASSSTITLSGSGAMDELRLYPRGAQMSTYTYTPLVGLGSTADANGEIVYYEYDGLNRLKNIKDYKGDIVKNYQYNFANSCGSNCTVLPMQTFTGSNTLGYPVGVFNVNGKLLGNASGQSAYITLWMGDTANSHTGTLSAGADSMHFHLALNSGKTPPAAITGLRYYQFDLSYTGIDAIRNSNGAYVDFGDSTGMRLGRSVYDTAGLVLAPNTTINYFNPTASPYFKHSYSSSSTKTITIYHNDGYGYESQSLDNYSNPATSLTLVKNLRGNLPQYNTNGIRGSCFQDSTFNTVANITNWNSITSITNFSCNVGDGVNSWKNLRFAQDFMQNNRGLTVINTSGSGYYRHGYIDSTFKISRLKTDWNTYFTALNELDINEAHWNHEDLSALTNLQHFFLVADNLKHSNVNDGTNPVIPIDSSVIDNALIQIAAGAGQNISNGTIYIFSSGSNRTSASDAAVTLLQSKGWTIAINVGDH